MAAEFSPTHDVDSASDLDSSDVPLPPVVDVSFSFSTPETVHSNRITGIQTRDERRKKIVDAILQKFNNGKLQKGSIKAVAAQFNMSRRWVGELWRTAKGQLVRGQAINVQCRWQGNAGKKPKVVDFSKLSEIPFHQRKTLRAISHYMNVSTSTAHNWLKEMKIRRHSNAIKPFLCEKGRLKRLRYCLSLISPTSLPNNPTFHDCYNYIHIDEKWFYFSKETTTFYKLPDEESKTHILKIMFLAAVGRPRFGDDGEALWDGKIGIFPFTCEEAAQRSSRNRPAGTMETKPVPKITRDVMRNMMVQKLLPAIREKWPGTTKHVLIQYDNTKLHVDINDPEFVSAAKEGDWDIQLQYQPPNSPDLNVLDLGFFRAIDAIQEKTAPRKLGDLIVNVQTAFEQLTPQN